MPDTIAPPPIPAQAGVAGQSPAQNTGPTDPGFWSDRIAGLDQSRTQAATGNLVAAQGVDPDHAAIARTLSPVLGIPAPAIEADPKTYSSMFALRADRATMGTDQVLKSWLAGDPGNAKVAQGDVQNLGAFGKLWRGLSAGYQQSALSSQIGQIGDSQAAGIATPAQANQAQTDQERLSALPPSKGIAGTIGGFVGGAVQGVKGAVPDVLAGAATGAATGALAGGVGAIPGALGGAISGLVLGMAGNAGVDTSGQVYAQLSGVTDKQGKPISEPVKAAASIGAGLITGALGLVGGDTLSAPAKALAGKFTSDVIAEAVTRPTITRALGSLATSAAKAGVTGAIVNGGQAAAQMLAPEIAKAISSPDFQTVFNDPAQRQAAIQSIVKQMEIGAIAFPAMELPMHGVSLIADGLRAHAATDQAGAFDQVMGAATASKTRQRAPDAFQTLAAGHVAAGGPDTLYVPGDAVAQLYQTLGTEPGAPDDPFRFVPDMRDQMEQAQATGGDVQIPTADYAAHVPADVDQALRSSGQVRFAPDGMTAAEAADFEARHGGSMSADPAFMQSLADELSKPGENPDDKIGIVSDAYEQLRKAGHTEDTANQHAALIGERYATRGARLGVSPRELYDDEGLTVQRAPEPAAMVPDALDRVMDTIRRGDKQPDDRQLYGPSLAEYLSTKPEDGRTDGGLIDHKGELASIGAADWHKGKPFARRLVNAKGQPLDDATRRAWEAGYFPDKAERPEVNDLLDALREDINGNPIRRTPSADAHARGQFRDQVEHVQRVLEQDGIDPHEASNDEVRAALQRHSTETTLMQAAAREPDVVLRGDELGVYSTPKEMIAAARSHLDALSQERAIQNPELGPITVNKLGIGKTMSKIGPEKAALIPALRQIIERGHVVETTAPRHPDGNIKAFHTLETTVRIGDKDVTANTIVREDHRGNFFYDVRRIEGAPKLFQVRGDTPPAEPPVPQGDEPARSPSPALSADSEDIGQKPDDINLSLSQPGEGAARGSITMADNARTITLFRQANLSTVLHELGHQWLDELERDAVREDAPQQLRDDLATVHKWLGVKDGERAGVEHHEKWAQGFEAYLMEGKAPSPALRGPFQKFAAWLARIYRSVVTLGGAVPPRISGVMDRLLATDDAIEQARSGLGVREPLFKTPGDAGMSIDEWHRYQRAIRGAKDAAYDKVLHRAMKVERDRATAEWKQAADEARPGVEADIKARPVLRAWSHLATGRDISNPDAEVMPIKLDRASVEGILHGSTGRLPTGVIGAKGMHPDAVAPLFGYDSGEQMLDDLISENGARDAMEQQAGKRLSFKKYVAALVDQGTDDAVKAKLGDPLTDGGIEEAAIQAAHNATQADVLAMEMRAAANQAGVPHPMEMRHLKAYVAGKMAEMRIGDAVRVAAYRRAEGKAGRDAERALLAGKPLEAFHAKQRQLMSHLYATRAQEISEEWDRTMKYWRGVAKSPTRAGTDQAFMDQAHGVLARLGMTPARDAGELARGLEGKPLDRFIEDQAALGYEIVAPDFIRSGAPLPHYTDMTADQFQGASDAVRSLLKNGRAAEEVTLDGKRVALDDLVAEAVARLDQKRSLPKSDRLHPEKARDLEGLMFSMSHGGRSIDAYLGKMEQFMHEWDGEKSGPFLSVFDRIKQAGYDERDRGAVVAKQWRGLKDGLPKDWSKRMNDQMVAHELINAETGKPHVFTRDEMLGIALNVGNASNLDKLTRGYGWDDRSVMSFLHRTMTKPDWDFVQGTWNIFESLYPDIEAMHRRVTGVGMAKVEHTPIETQHGTYPGGYFPVVYDATRAPSADKAERASELFDQNYTRATTAKGHTIARTDYAAPLRLGTDQVAWKLSQAIHDLTHREAIMDAWKFFNHKEITAAIRDKMGDEYVRTPNRWLKDIANKANVDDKMLGFLGNMVRRVSAVGIGFRMTTVMKHGMTALSNSISTVGGADFLAASREFSSPARARETASWIMQRSGEMRHRFESVDNNARESLKSLLGDHSWVQNVERFGYYPVSGLDFASAMPTWLAAYRRAMGDGIEDKEAVLHADRQVRFAHGASNPEDLPEVQRSQLMKLFTMFYSFANHMYNQGLRPIVRGSVSAVRNAKAGDSAGARRDMVGVAGRSFSYMVMPGLISALVANQAYEGNESWIEQGAASILGEAAAGIPLLRDLASSVLNGYQFQDTPLNDVATSSQKTAQDIARATGLTDKPVSDRWLQHAITSAGYATGLPLGQPAQSAQYLWDYGDGTADPHSLGDFMHGLVYGPTTVKK